MAQPIAVVITGIGLISPLGDSSRIVHAGLCEGRSALTAVDEFPGITDSRRLAGLMAADAPNRYLAGRNVNPLDRSARLLSAAAELALVDGRWLPDDPCRADSGLFVGTVFSSVHTISEFDLRAQSEGPAYASPLAFANTVINAPAGQTAIWHGLRGVNRTFATGGSSGLDAIGCGAESVRYGRSACLLAGGFEELSQETFDAFEGLGLTSAGMQLPAPFSSNANSLALSEGAALLVLESRASASARRAPVLAEALGYGTAFDPSGRTDAHLSVHSIAQSMKSALAHAKVGPGQIDVICASANGLESLDQHERLAFDDVFAGSGMLPAVCAIKALLGESLGAAGAFQCAVMIEAIRRGTIPAVCSWAQDGQTAESIAPGDVTSTRTVRLCLINALSIDGHASSLVLAI